METVEEDGSLQTKKTNKSTEAIHGQDEMIQQSLQKMNVKQNNVNVVFQMAWLAVVQVFGKSTFSRDPEDMFPSLSDRCLQDIDAKGCQKSAKSSAMCNEGQ